MVNNESGFMNTYNNNSSTYTQTDMHARNIQQYMYNIKPLQCRKQMIHGWIVEWEQQNEKETGYKQSVPISVCLLARVCVWEYCKKQP